MNEEQRPLTPDEHRHIDAILLREYEKKHAGIYEKYHVARTDGSDLPGGKHHGCRYFVLDMTHDRHARAALAAYAQSCQDEFPQLAKELRDWAFQPLEHALARKEAERPTLSRYSTEAP